MRDLEKRMEKSRCEWLKGFLKKKLNERDMKCYNRTKRIIYYFPSILDNLKEEDFNTAISYPDETYICLSEEDTRYAEFDNLYKTLRGEEFKPSKYGETRYLTIEEICTHFGI